MDKDDIEDSKKVGYTYLTPEFKRFCDNFYTWYLPGMLASIDKELGTDYDLRIRKEIELKFGEKDWMTYTQEAKQEYRKIFTNMKIKANE